MTQKQEPSVQGDAVNAEAKKSTRLTVREIVCVIPLMAVIICGAVTAMQAEHEWSFFKRRGNAVEAMVKNAPENKLAAEAYASCLKPKKYDEIGSTCALEAASVVRSEGRSEAEVADVLAQIGIFERGCDADVMRSPDVVGITEELSTLRADWCKRQPEDTVRARG